MNSSKTQGNRLGLTLTLVAGLMAAVFGIEVPSAEAARTKCESSTGASWDQAQTGSCRFAVLSDFGGAAVKDNNTGLVWEQAPDATGRQWYEATDYCVNKTVGGTVGWRLPSVVELKSVQDPSLASPFVPASVFTGVQSTPYWSASLGSIQPGSTWLVYFTNGTVDRSGSTSGFSYPAWCVRGPMQESAY